MKIFFFTNNPVLFGGLLTTLMVGVIGLAVSVYVYKELEEAATQSCISSVRDTLVVAISLNRVNEVIKTDRTWRDLTEEEKVLLFDVVKDSGRFDCSRFPYFKQGKTSDGHDLRISVRKVDGTYEVEIGCPGKR